MDELIAKLEAASGPDRALDYDIAHFVTSAHFGLRGKAPAYTSSIDAALTLVPKGWRLSMLTEESDNAPWFAGLATGDDDTDSFVYREGFAAMPALALCIAALKARNHD